jgi:hypothetical protein
LLLVKFDIVLRSGRFPQYNIPAGKNTLWTVATSS